MLAYYQQVFLDILRTIISCHGHLLTDWERSAINDIVGLPEAPQRLLFRLVGRARTWHREDKLEYDKVDIGRIGPVPSSVFERDPEDMEAWLRAMRADELRIFASEHYAGCFCARAAKRMAVGELIGLMLSERRPKQARLSFGAGGVLAASRCSERDLLVLAKKHVNCSLIRVAPAVAGLIDGFVLPAFFLNAADPTEELQRAMWAKANQIKYPPFSIIRSRPVFEDRRSFEAYREGVHYQQSLRLISDDSESITDTAMELLSSFSWLLATSKGVGNEPYFLRRYHPLWPLAKCLEHMVGRLEAIGEYRYAEALLVVLLEQQVVCCGRRGAWWERLVIDRQKHLKRDRSLVIESCRDALLDTHVRMGSRWAITNRLKRLQGEQLPLSRIDDVAFIDYIMEDPVRSANGRRPLEFVVDKVEGEIGSVEELALRHYCSQGWEGVHSESSVFTMIFAIVFWDVLFSATTDVFQTPYQTHPLDLRTDSFFTIRKDMIESLLASILCGGYEVADFEASYKRSHDTVCIGVNWRAYSLDFLKKVFDGLGAEALVAILRLLAMDYRNHSSGMPDLVLWRSGRVMLVEVKSANDKLSDQQKGWLDIFQRANVCARVCKVKSPGT